MNHFVAERMRFVLQCLYQENCGDGAHPRAGPAVPGSLVVTGVAPGRQSRGVPSRARGRCVGEGDRMSLSLSLAVAVLGSGLVFCALWWLDHKTHEAIWRADILDGELRTHRLILFASWGLLGSLVLMGFNRWVALPLFVGCLVTYRSPHDRTVRYFAYRRSRHCPARWIKPADSANSPFQWYSPVELIKLSCGG